MDGDRTITSTQPATDGRFDGSLPHAGPARVGAELRMVREQLGWTLPALSARLRIRQPFLEAIEAGDLAALPAPAYAAGFIRTYADATGLDPDEILRRFRAEGMTRAPKPELSFPDPVPDRAVPPMAVALIVAVVAIGAYALWYHHSEEQIRAANSVPSVPAKLAPLASGSQSASAGAKAAPVTKAAKGNKEGGSTAPAVATLAPGAPAAKQTAANQSGTNQAGAKQTGTNQTGTNQASTNQAGTKQAGTKQAGTKTASGTGPTAEARTGAAPSAANNPSAANGVAAASSSAATSGSAPTIDSSGSATANAQAASSGVGPGGTATTAATPTTTTPGATPSAASTGPATGGSNSGSSMASTAAPSKPASSATASPAASSGPALQVSATAKSWVQIRGPHGKVVYSGILDPGQTWTVPDEPGLVMTTGNAGGTVLVRNGKAGSPLGAPGSVLHGVQLTGNGNTDAGGAAAGKSP